MSLVFMFYLLCAITDCPPPVVHSENPTTNVNTLNLRRTRDPIAGSASSIVGNRLVRSSNSSSFRNRLEIPIVGTALGNIQGRLVQSRGGREIAAFEGIPYTSPPVGNLRFRNPVPVSPWTGRLLVANKTRMDCLQLDFGRLLQVRGLEDCLYLNVYSPLEPMNDTLLPVIVFIHGGGWMSHSGSYYGPRYLLDKEDVILVTFNYRLGVLGFLSTGDKSAFGNFGLKDQFEALKFIRDHIKAFGGNPKKITLMGESTGAGSVALHILSPMTSKEISIHGGILLSGGSLNHWSVMNDTFSNSKAIAKSMNCPTEKSESLVACLRMRDPYMVVGQQLHLWTIPTISRLLFGPVIESSDDNPKPFLLEAPEVTYNTKRNSIASVPIISGLTRNEGAIFAANVYLAPFLFNKINRNYNKMTSYAMGFDKELDAAEIASKVSNFYFNGRPWSTNNLDQISDALGDRTITMGVYKFLRQHSQVAPTYGYFFTYLSKSHHSLLNQAGLRHLEWGVSHGDELPFIFSMDRSFDDLKTPNDLAVSEFMVTVCANFARDRQPFPKNIVKNKVIWSPIINPNYMKVLEINEGKRMTSFPYMNRMKLWESLALN